MLTLSDRHHRLDRRGFLTLGALGLGGLTLNSLLQAAGEQPGIVTGRSVIFLFQQGGPSQFETFDPKPEASASIRTLTGTCATSLPGVRFGDTLGQLAEVAHKLVVIRSFQTGNAQHNIVPIVSGDTMQANIGSLYSRVAGAINPETGMPTNAVLFPQAACQDVAKGGARGDIAATGAFGSAYAPFIPGAGGNLQKDMRLNLPRDRFEDRHALRYAFDNARRDWEAEEPGRIVDRFQEQAYQLLLNGGAADALDLTKEASSVVARYDTRRYAAADWSRSNRGKRGYYTGQAKSIGKLMLMARRMCEAGCGFVTIHADYEGVWDMHADTENLNVVDGMEAVGRSFVRSRGGGVHRRCRGPRAQRENPARLLRRDGTDAANQPQRRTRSLGEARTADVVRRRHPRWPGHRPIHARRRRARHRAFDRAAFDFHDPAHCVRCRPPAAATGSRAIGAAR